MTAGGALRAERRRAAATNFGFGIAGLVFTLVTGIVMVPYYLGFFGLGTYGAWLASGGVVSALGVIESGLATVVTQKLASAAAAGDDQRVADVMFAGVAISAGLGAIVTAAGWMLAPHLPSWVGAAPEDHRALLLGIRCASVGAGLSTLFLTLGALPQAFQRPFGPGVISTAALAANLLAIIAGLQAGLGVTALALGPLALSLTYVAGYVMLSARLWRELRIPAPRATAGPFRELRHDALRMFVSKAAGTIAGQLEATIVSMAVSPAAAARFTLTMRPTQIVQMVGDRFGSAIFAGAALDADPSRAADRRRFAEQVLATGTTLAAIGLSLALLFTPPLMRFWVGPHVFIGYPVLVLIVLASYLWITRGLFWSFAAAAGQFRDISVASIIDAVCRLAGLAILGFLIGTAGIPLGSAVASAVTGGYLWARFARSTPSVSSRKRVSAPPALLAVVAITVAWLIVVPVPESIPALLLQFCIAAALLMAATILVDGQWSSFVKRLLSGVRPAAH